MKKALKKVCGDRIGLAVVGLGKGGVQKIVNMRQKRGDLRQDKLIKI